MELLTESELSIQADVHKPFLACLRAQASCRLILSKVGPQGYRKKNCWTYCQNLVRLLVEDITQWPWDPGGNSEERTLCREMPGDDMCCQVRVETLSQNKC